MTWKPAPEELVKFLAGRMKNIDCEYRKMFGYPAYFINGNMFAGLFEDMLFLRLSESDREEMMRLQPGARPLEPRPGRAMKEYVVLPEELYRDEKLFDEWLGRSYAYASALPSKRKGEKK
jgi:TfoX/Sxy family transcriptional regulator of competence genes